MGKSKFGTVGKKTHVSKLITPAPNEAVIRIMQALLPFYLRLEQTQIVVLPECLTTLRRLSGESVVIAVNHSDRSDPVSVFALSKYVQEKFFYLSARELFDEAFGLKGWFLRHSGGYSVIRGEPEDKESRDLTVSLIAEASTKLVMFPEGDVSGRDDIILPPKPDGIRNLLEAYMRRQTQTKRSVFLLPVGMYYAVSPSAIASLAHCLGKLEALTAISSPSPNAPFHERIYRLASNLVSQLEKQHGMPTSSDKPLDLRLLSLCRHMTISLAEYCGVQCDTTMDDRKLLYSVRGNMRRLQMQLEREPPQGKFGTQLIAQRSQRVRRTTPELDRIQQLLILQSTLQQSNFSLSHTWRVIDRLEHLIANETTVKGSRTVWIAPGDAIDLAQFQNAFESDRENAIIYAGRQIRQAMKQALSKATAASGEPEPNLRV